MVGATIDKVSEVGKITEAEIKIRDRMDITRTRETEVMIEIIEVANMVAVTGVRLEEVVTSEVVVEIEAKDVVEETEEAMMATDLPSHELPQETKFHFTQTISD